MVKKILREAGGKKKIRKKGSSKPRVTGSIHVEQALVENFISLQKVLTNLSIKFDNLSENISKLLNLFELSAKSLAEKDLSKEKANKDTKKILDQLDVLLSQNKIIAKGLALLHEPLEEIPENSQMQFSQMQPIPPPSMPLSVGLQQTQEIQSGPGPSAGYQRSITTGIPSEPNKTQPIKRQNARREYPGM
jgi:hypothetical protein